MQELAAAHDATWRPSSYRSSDVAELPPKMRALFTENQVPMSFKIDITQKVSLLPFLSPF